MPPQQPPPTDWETIYKDKPELDPEDWETVSVSKTPVTPTKALPQQPSTEPGNFWGGVGKSITSGEALKTGLWGGAGWLQGAIADLPASLWEGAKLGASMVPPAAIGYLIRGEKPPLQTMLEGLPELPGHVAEITSKAGSDPVPFGRMVGQITGQPIATEAAIAGAPSAIRMAGRPIEATGRIIKDYQPISDIGVRVVAGAAGHSVGGPAGAVLGGMYGRAPKIIRGIESGLGGMIERGGQRMRNVGIDPNAAALEEFWGRTTPGQNPIERYYEPKIREGLQSSDPFSRAWSDRPQPLTDAEALRDFYGGPKGVPISPEDITINTGSDPLSRAWADRPPGMTFEEFQGGPSPASPSNEINVGDFSDPLSRAWSSRDIPPDAPVVPPEGMISMEGRGSIDVQPPARPGAHTPLPQDTSIDDLTAALRKELTPTEPSPPVSITPKRPDVIADKGLTDAQKAELLAEGYKPAVRKGKPVWKRTEPTGQPDPNSMWEQAKKLARDEKGEVDFEVFKAAYERLKNRLGMKPGEVGGRVAQFEPKGLRESLSTEDLQRFLISPSITPELKIEIENLLRSRGVMPNPENAPPVGGPLYKGWDWDTPEQVPTRPDSPPFPESELEMSDVVNRATRSVADERFKAANHLYPEEWNRYQELSAAFQNSNFRDLPLETQQAMRAEFRELHQRFPHVQNMGKIGDLQNVIDESNPPRPGFEWNEGPPAEPITEPGLPFGPIEARPPELNIPPVEGGLDVSKLRQRNLFPWF